jgi:long-chain acyl-CoA synthetase
MKELVFTRSLLPVAERLADQAGYTDAVTGRTENFGPHMSAVARLADAMSGQLRVNPDDRVAVLAANSLPYLTVWHASLLGAAVINPLNVRFSADELAYVLADSQSKACFVDAAFAGAIEEVRHRTELRHVILLDAAGPGVDTSASPADVTLSELIGAGKEALPPEPSEDQPAVLIYTGGTTGRPKGVLIEQRAEVLNQYHFAMEVPWRRDQPFLIQTPMFHGASMLGVVGAPMFGIQTVVIPGFDPSASLAATATYRVGMTVMVPTMIGMLFNHPDFTAHKLSSLKRIIYGASPMPRALLDRLLSTLPETEIIQGYGMTEGCTILTVLDDAEHRAGTRLGSAGRPLPGVELCAQDTTGAILDAGQVGEICARGGNFMTGYLNQPEATEQAMRGGWYHSGDMGYLDSDGFLFLVDRAKDMVISGGENVYSVEVENAVASHPAVLQVAVIGVPHEVWGEAVHAVVVVKPGATVTEDEIIAHARTTIAGYKVPRSVEFRTEPLPLSAAMKVLKRELRAPYWQGMDRAIN